MVERWRLQGLPARAWHRARLWPWSVSRY